MLKFVLILLIFSTLTEILAADQISITDSDKLVIEGLDHIYNLKFDKAEFVFKNIQKSYPDDIKGYFYESVLYFFRTIPYRDEKMFDKYIEHSENVLNRCEKLLEKNENDIEALYYKGLTHSYVSLLMLSLNKSLLKAASNGNDGYRILNLIIEKNPDFYDAYMGLGLYKVVLGHVPENFKWLLSLLGFNGNIKDGMEMLKVSMENGKFTKTDSKVFLVLFSLNEKESRDQTALKYSEQLVSQYPQSPVFRVLFSSILLQYGENEKSVENAEISLELNKFSFQDQIIKSSSAVIGTAYFRMNEFEKSIPFLEKFMQLTIFEDRYNTYLFTLGTSYELTGNRTEAVSKYSKVRDNFISERDGELDKIFYRYSRDRIENPISEFDKRLIIAANIRESGNPEEAIKIYEKMISDGLLKSALSDDLLIRYYFDAGLAYVYTGNIKKAKEYFSKCTTYEPKNETWFIPHSYFELGKIYYREGNKDKAEEMFENIYDYDDFDFESFLDMRLANFRNKN